jgi:hypothetical protein
MMKTRRVLVLLISMLLLWTGLSAPSSAVPDSTSGTRISSQADTNSHNSQVTKKKKGKKAKKKGKCKKGLKCKKGSKKAPPKRPAPRPIAPLPPIPELPAM